MKYFNFTILLIILFCLPYFSAASDKGRYAGLSQETLYYLRQSYEELAEYFDAKNDKKRADEMRAKAAAVPVSEEILKNPPKHASLLNTTDLPEPKVFPQKGSISETILQIYKRSPAETESLQNALQKLKKPDPENRKASADYLLNRYLLGLSTKNLDAVTAFFASFVEFPGYDRTLSKEELIDLYAELLATYHLDTLTASDFYQTDMTPQLRESDKDHMEYILYAQDKPPLVLENSGYWKQFFGNVHVYTFSRQNDGDWYLTSLRTLPLE